MNRLFYLATLILLLCFACSDDAETHQALELDSSDPTIAQGGWFVASPSGSASRAGLAGAGGSPSVSGIATSAGSSLVGTAFGGSSANSLGSTTPTNTAGAATAVATGGQPNLAPTTTGAGGFGPTAPQTGGTTNASAGVGGSAGAAGSLATTGGLSSTRVFPTSIGPDTPVRVLFDSIAGTSTDDSVHVLVRLENRSATDPFPLKDVEVVYWGMMATIKSIACLCDSPICGAATVGTFRSAHNQANCGFIYHFPGFELQPAKSVVLSWNCHYTDFTTIDESTHYSYPFGLQPGDEMPRVTVVNKAKQELLWGILPE